MSSPLFHSIHHIDGFNNSNNANDRSAATIEFSNFSTGENLPENGAINNIVDARSSEEFCPENNIQLIRKLSDYRHPLTEENDVPVNKISNDSVDPSTIKQNGPILQGPNIPNNLFSSIIGNIPSQGSASFIDGHMSDVLLLAIYKGFQTPELQTYMTTLEERIFAYNQKCSSHQEYDSNTFHSNNLPHFETRDSFSTGVFKTPIHIQNENFPEGIKNTSHLMYDTLDQDAYNDKHNT